VVLAAVAATLALSVAAGLGLARLTGMGRMTAGLGMLPGAAPALIAVGDETGADSRLVAIMQLGRIALVLASVPVLAILLAPAGGGRAASGAVAPASEAGSGALAGLPPVAAAAAIAAAGVLLARRARAPAGTLVGPLLLAAVLAGSGLFPLHVPSVLADLAFAVVGLGVGLRFDRSSLRNAGRLALPITGAILALALASAALGAVLFAALRTDPLTAYLATTPGGISAVLAAAFDSGADVTIVVAVQTLRLVLLAVLAPFVARLLSRPSRE
jgi:uncharacterized protein